MKLLLFLLMLVYLSASEEPKEDFHEEEARSHNKFSHKCIHDELEAWKREQGIVEHVEHLRKDHVEVPYDPSNREKRHLSQQNRPTFKPIRIYIAEDHLTGDPYTCYQVGQTIQAMQGTGVVTYTCGSADVLTQTKKNYLLNTLLPVSIGWLQSALNVVTVVGNLSLNIGSCTSTPLAVLVPNNYAYPGVDADFIIFITSRPIMGGATLAFASTCATDNTGRPIAGQANFNTSNLYGQPEDLPEQSGVAIHEMSHALGFSSTRWQYGTFIEYTGQSNGNWEYSVIPASSSYTTDETGLTHQVLITPTVVATVRELFGCSNIVGGAMEDGGGSGTVASHWEKRIFMNEYMTGSEVNNPILSNLTLALFADTGWYEVNYNVTQRLTWGRNLGCGFVEEDCSNWTNIVTTDPGFCSAVSQTVSCSYGRLGYGICNLISTLSGIPSYYQHYPSPEDPNPSTGGQSLLADYCGYVGQEGITTFCNTGSGSSVQQASDYTSFFGLATTGEAFGLQSRCMETTLNHINVGFEIDSFANIIIPNIQSCRCYNHSCVGPDDLRIQVNGVWYPCNGNEISVFGFGGSLTCPPAEELCAGSPVDNTWPQLFSVSPNIGPPSTVITLTGANFNTSLFNYSVIMEIPCSNIIYVNNQTIVATIPGGDYFVSVADLSVFNTKLNLVVQDSRGYTAQLGSSFTIQVAFDAEYLMNLFNWMGANPLWAFIIWACILTPLFCICCCVYKCCKKMKKKPKRKGNHEYANERDFYAGDDFEVDDHYNVAQTANVAKPAQTAKT